jgi:hypothetical protein
VLCHCSMWPKLFRLTLLLSLEQTHEFLPNSSVHVAPPHVRGCGVRYRLIEEVACAQGKLDPVVGRTKEIDRVIQILGRRTKNNPCLVGEPGVGKTAVAEGLAQKIANGDVPETIEGKRVVTLDMGLLVAGTKYRGEFEERLKKLMDEIKQNDDIILVR